MPEIPEQMNASDYFVDRNLRENRGRNIAVIDAADGRQYSYDDINGMTNRFGNALVRVLYTRLHESQVRHVLNNPPVGTSADAWSQAGRRHLMNQRGRPLR